MFFLKSNDINKKQIFAKIQDPKQLTICAIVTCGTKRVQLAPTIDANFTKELTKVDKQFHAALHKMALDILKSGMLYLPILINKYLNELQPIMTSKTLYVNELECYISNDENDKYGKASIALNII